MRRPLTTLLCTAWTILLACCAPAGADVFGPIGVTSPEPCSLCAPLASAGFLPVAGGEAKLQQAFYAHDPAISGNGRYVAFDGYFGGLAGVWRRDLQTGEVQPVAVGAQFAGTESCMAQAPCDAELPSISADGRYVSFTTAARLAPVEDTNGAPDVYVRDMSVPEAQTCEEGPSGPVQPCAFTLVSAVNGGSEGLTYESASERYGAIAAGRSAISADGQRVAFVTTASSNLVGPGTPALQVAVRNLATRETQLVSAEYDPASGNAIPGKPVSDVEGGVTYGAVYSPITQPPTFPFNNRAYALTPSVGASISADGTTVAWMGRAVFKQARMLPGEDKASYAEPLWRRIADGPLASTRRVTGGSEPENPACVAKGESELPGAASQSFSDPCQGPFAVEPAIGVWDGTRSDGTPQLSADGYEVAFLSTAQLVSLGADFGRSAESEANDLYLVNMRDTATRNQALRPLTELASGHETERAPDAPIVDVGVSPDGSQVAFSTQRTEFPLGSPAYVSQPAAVAGMAELFDVDLANDTLTRVTGGYEGAPSERPHKAVTSGETPYKLVTDGALSPSFSDDGNRLAFSSTASNLVYGDGNTPSQEPNTGSSDGSDAFVTARKLFPQTPTETFVSSPPASPSPTPDWILGVTAVSLPDGSVRLYVQVPGVGRLSAVAASPVTVASAATAPRQGARSRRAHRSIVVRRVASAATAVGANADGLVTLTLRLARGYSALAARSGGLSTAAKIVFQAPGRPVLSQSVEVSFVRRTKPAHVAKRRAHRR